MTARSIILIILLLLPLAVWGHGENSAGPNKGFIRMPGPFHTEVVPIGGNQFKVYLLDINFKNPSVKNSTLQLIFADKLSTPAHCSIDNKTYYLCSFPKSLAMNKGTRLILNSQREGQKGMEVIYELPLQHQDQHSTHRSH